MEILYSSIIRAGGSDLLPQDLAALRVGPRKGQGFDLARATYVAFDHIGLAFEVAEQRLRRMMTASQERRATKGKLSRA